MKPGKLGIWALINEFSAQESAAFAKRVEDWGYSTLWLPEALGRDPVVASSWLLANTTQLQIATGIMNIYARDAMATVNSQYGLAEQSDGRFLLGLGVSHPPLVENFRGHQYQKPLAAMRTYLETIQSIQYQSPPPEITPNTVIAALGPKMMALAASHTDGAHTYNVSPVHTAQARHILSKDKWLCVEQKVLLEEDPQVARTIGRNILAHSMNLPAYRNNFRRMGFTASDLADGCSDALVDSIIAWGDIDAIKERIESHWDAGADHVCIQCLPKAGMKLTRKDETVFELLAPST